jgi:hypothetical protein
VDEFKEIELTLQAKLPRKIWTTPDVLNFDTRKGEQESELRIESDLPGLLEKFQSASACRELVSVEVKEKTQKRIVLRVCVARDAPVGDAFDYIVLRFNDLRYSLHTLSVRSHKEPDGKSQKLGKRNAENSYGQRYVGLKMEWRYDGMLCSMR